MKKLKYFLFTCVGLGILFAFVTLIFYFLTFPGELSEKTSDWANFGSLLAGVFTLTGSLLTALTLLIIHEENRKSQAAREQQSTALTFEQYMSHRSLFIDELKQALSESDRQLYIASPDILYNKIFPDNNPTQVSNYKIDIASGTKVSGDLCDLVGYYSSIKTIIQNRSEGVTFHIAMLYSKLHIECNDKSLNGDFMFCNKTTGVNVYRLNECLKQAEKLINTLLRFTGNHTNKSNDLEIDNKFQCRAIEDYSHDEQRNGFGLFRSRNLKVVEEIYVLCNEFPARNKHLPNLTYLLFGPTEFWKNCMKDENKAIESMFASYYQDKDDAGNALTKSGHPYFSHYQNICIKMGELRSLVDS